MQLKTAAVRDFLLREAGINKIIKTPLLLQGNVLNYNYEWFNTLHYDK